ncbi:MAG: class I SAM-dependent methyltransferase [Fibrobacterales bacterium]
MEWFERWFQEEYDNIYVNRNDQQATDQVAALLNYLELPKGASIIDIGCGKARHLKELLNNNMSAVGIDLSHYLLKRAQELSLPAILPIARADMRDLPFPKGSFDLACSFFTSFGYFETREENFALLGYFADMVKPGGYIFLDLMNKDAVLETLPKKDTQVIDGKIVTQDRTFTGGCVCKEITIEYAPDRVEKYHERVMVFEQEDLYDLFKSVNLSVQTIFGDEQGNPFTQDSPRMSFVLKKGD